MSAHHFYQKNTLKCISSIPYFIHGLDSGFNCSEIADSGVCAVNVVINSTR